VRKKLDVVVVVVAEADADAAAEAADIATRQMDRVGCD
jgi:hypothetical protein